MGRPSGPPVPRQISPRPRERAAEWAFAVPMLRMAYVPGRPVRLQLSMCRLVKRGRREVTRRSMKESHEQMLVASRDELRSASCGLFDACPYHGALASASTRPQLRLGLPRNKPRCRTASSIPPGSRSALQPGNSGPQSIETRQPAHPYLGR